MIRAHIFIIVLALLYACNNNQSTQQEASQPAAETKVNQPEHCYTSAKNGDTVLLNLTIRNNAVTGYLLYNYIQKDKNRGTISGILKGDTLFADYTFQSEGMQSVREVAFLKSGNGWAEGYGEVKEERNKMVFANKSALQFDSNNRLDETACAK